MVYVIIKKKKSSSRLLFWSNIKVSKLIFFGLRVVFGWRKRVFLTVTGTDFPSSKLCNDHLT